MTEWSGGWFVRWWTKKVTRSCEPRRWKRVRTNEGQRKRSCILASEGSSVHRSRLNFSLQTHEYTREVIFCRRVSRFVIERYGQTRELSFTGFGLFPQVGFPWERLKGERGKENLVDFGEYSSYRFCPGLAARYGIHGSGKMRFFIPSEQFCPT